MGHPFFTFAGDSEILKKRVTNRFSSLTGWCRKTLFLVWNFIVFRVPQNRASFKVPNEKL